MEQWEDSSACVGLVKGLCCMFATKITIFKNYTLGSWRDWRGSAMRWTPSGKEASSDRMALVSVLRFSREHIEGSCCV